MGVYTEYLDTLKAFPAITAERKKQLARIAQLRGGIPVLVLASDIQKGNTPISIDYSDPLAIRDQLDNLTGESIDIILETPGGIGEVAEDIVRGIRAKFKNVSFIIPGVAKSAGTIMVMGGDEILMDDFSSLGPIDAQISRQGKTFSADAFLDGLTKIKDEVQQVGTLNKAYVPILREICPGDIQECENAQNFAKTLVTDWLVRYKFRNWTTHSDTGQPVTSCERHQRAEEIARDLSDHSKWLTHGRSIKIDDLQGMRLRVTDLRDNPQLQDAVRRYYTLLRLTFDSSSIFKIFETVNSQISRFANIQPVVPAPTREARRGAERWRSADQV